MEEAMVSPRCRLRGRRCPRRRHLRSPCRCGPLVALDGRVCCRPPASFPSLWRSLGVVCLVVAAPRCRCPRRRRPCRGCATVSSPSLVVRGASVMSLWSFNSSWRPLDVVVLGPVALGVAVVVVPPHLVSWPSLVVLAVVPRRRPRSSWSLVSRPSSVVFVIAPRRGGPSVLSPPVSFP